MAENDVNIQEVLSHRFFCYKVKGDHCVLVWLLDEPGSGYCWIKSCLDYVIMSLVIEILPLMSSPDQPNSKCVEFVMNDLSLSTDWFVA